jgi:ribosomal protein L40E
MRQHESTGDISAPAGVICAAAVPIVSHPDVMTQTSKTCPDCGARVHANADNCDLCGVEVRSARPEAIPAAGAGPYCNECGAANPPGARFCSQCGAKIVALPPPTPPDEPEATQQRATEEPIGRQVAVLVGGATMIVLALFVVTLVSRQNVTTGGGESIQAPPSAMSVLEQSEQAPLDPAVEERAAAIEDELRTAQAEESLRLNHQLVTLYLEHGRPDRAAIHQQEIAEMTGQPEHWRDAGDLFFEWMEVADQPNRADIAQLAISAYDRVLAHQPDNYDVRANVAWALQYDMANPMRAIDETNYILENVPDHLQANFNRGYFLMRINRFDQAVEQFERVRDLAGAETSIGQQSSYLIEIIRSEQQRARRGG